MRKELTFQRASLLGLGAGLAMIVQPFSHFLFAAGFPFTLAALVAYNAAGWISGERAEKERAQARIAQQARVSAASRPAPGPGRGREGGP